MSSRYEQCLLSLWAMSPPEFKEVAAFNEEAVEQEQLNKLKSKEQAWILNLVKSVSPPKQEPNIQSFKKYPKWSPISTIAKGGEAILILAKNRWNGRIEVLKFPAPVAAVAKDTHGPKDAPEGQGIVRGAAKLLALGKNLYKSPTQKAKSRRGFDEFPEPPQEKPILSGSLDAQLLERIFHTQKGLHSLSKKIDPNFSIGRIPETYEFAPAPESFMSMEYIEGVGYLDFVTRTDDQNLRFHVFFKLVKFIQSVLHVHNVAHCDIAPKNVIVCVDQAGIPYPCLIDFGMAKTNNLDELTLQGAAKGTPLYASEKQMTDARLRGQAEDIFALGRLLWVTLARHEPDVSKIPAFVVDGKIKFDFESVASLFPQEKIHDIRLRDIFNKTQNFSYADSEDFLEDLYSLFLPYEKTQVNTCRDKCIWMIQLEAKIDLLAKVLGR